MQPPWIKKADPIFQQEKKYNRNNEEARNRYNTHKWRTASAKFFRGKRCAIEGCLRLAELTDHIIPIEQAGSQWDRRNWQPMCNHHHNIKRAKESHGYCEPKTGTPYGYIPIRNAHLPPYIVK